MWIMGYNLLKSLFDFKDFIVFKHFKGTLDSNISGTPNTLLCEISKNHNSVNS